MSADERVIARLEAMLGKADALNKTYKAPPSGFIGFEGWVDSTLFSEWRTQSLLLLRQGFGQMHTYATAFEAATSEVNMPSSVNGGTGILRAALEDLRDGHLFDVRSLLAAEIFSDFLDMAAHLIEQGFKDAAVSLSGAVLEDGLRKIAFSRQVAIKARDGLDALNTKLAAAGIYNAVAKARVNAWRVIRNAADHGNFGEYDRQQAREMVDGITQFLGTHLT